MSFLFNLARDHFSRTKQPKQCSVQSSFDLTFHVKHFIDLQGEAQHRQRQAHHPVKQSAANKTLVVLTQQICFQLLCSTWNTDPQARAIKLNVSRETNRHIRSLLAFIEQDIRAHWRKDILFHPRALRQERNATAVWVLPPKALPQSLQLVLETLIFRLSRFCRLLICFSPVCTAILQKIVSRETTHSKAARIAQKNRHTGSTRAFHKMRAQRSHRQIGAPAFTHSLYTALQARPAILKILYKNPHITPQLTAIKSKTRRWIHS